MERVTLVPGATRNADDDPVAGGPPVNLWAASVAPGTSVGNRDLGRNGRRVAYTVTFWPVPGQALPTLNEDVDQLRVRGTLCSIVVLDWTSPYTGRKGLEVLCSAGKG